MDTENLLPGGRDEMSLHGLNLTPALESLAVLIDLSGIAIIMFGFVVCAICFIRRIAKGAGLVSPMSDVRDVRRNLAIYILTGIEFMIASDIILTVASRALGDLLFVAFLVVIRTVISFFLGKDAEELSSEATPKR